MRWCVALGIVLAALVALTVRVSAHRPRTVTVIADEPEPEQPVAPRGPKLFRARPSAIEAPRTSPPRLAHLAAAHVFGRVRPSVDEETSLEGLTVTADDGVRSLEARVFSDGRFSLHLPAGQYAVTASSGDRVGFVPSVAARPGVERELTIQLGLDAAIRGHVRGPEGVTVSVRVSLAGREISEQTVDPSEGDDGDFAIGGLIPGRSYDLAFTGDDLRTTTLRSVTAPAEGLAAVVDALPVLRGAIGFPSDEDCPIERVVLREPAALATNVATVANDADDSDAQEEAGNVDDTCRFRLPVPEGSSQMILVATGSGWHLEEPVSIPPLGDPEPVCLNPPCRANPAAIEDQFVVY
jgi:hypothetical protein